MRFIQRLFTRGVKHGEDGLEYPDPRPVEIPANAKRPESLSEMIARMVQHQSFRNKLAEMGAETVEEANDFEIDDDDPEVLFSRSEQMARDIAENDDVQSGKAALAARRRSEALRSERGRGKDGERIGNRREYRDDDAGDDGDGDSRRYRNSAKDGERREGRYARREALRDDRSAGSDGPEGG